MPRLRRLSQAVFFALFAALLWRAGSRAAEARLPGAVRLFLESDPLVAIANALATRALYHGLLWGLAILIPTFFLGRFFCGWICPLGTLHHAVSSAAKPGRRRIESNRYKRWQSLKYYLLIGLLASAVFGGGLAGLVDPISLAVRSFAVSILPAAGLAKPFRQAVPMALVLLGILLLNLRITRFWCRALCPLGALLGAASRWSILGLEKRAGNCKDCNRCLLHCQGGDDPIPGAPWRKPECHLCMNCVADCPDGGLGFRFFPHAPAAIDRPSLERRWMLTGAVAGVAALPLLRADTGLEADAHERRIRPPAALGEEAFLARCIRCGECMRVCPGHALHPAFTEAGWEGIWTPVVVPRIGYCEPSCTLCGQACPTGAIREFTAGQKGWVGGAGGSDAGETIRIGTAFFDRGRCLPWAMATECIVCEERCPTSPKAIYLRPAAVTDAAGNGKQVRQPYLDPARCVGCGACEFACPLKDRPAVYVTSAGESRSRANRVFLGEAATPPRWLPAGGEAPGWERPGEIRSFAAADLWKYLDGDAERYLRAGVRRTVTAAYRNWSGLEAVADVHQMADAVSAAGIFDSESPAGSRPVPLGDAARSYGQSLTFHKGPFFVRLVAFQDTAGGEAALIGLGRAIEMRLER